VKVAILSDIHSAAEHFRDALNDARAEGFDALVILGDLFTYGPDPVETLELVQDAISRDGAILITGNHDLLYLEGPERAAYVSRLADWIRESVDWTAGQLDGGDDLDRLPWQAEWEQDGVLLSHANPFGFGDWTYLRDEAGMAAAWQSLQDRSFDWGVFGHVHRFRRFDSERGRGGVVTVGSIGQPRDKAEPFSQWAMMDTAPQFAVEQRRVARDWASTIQRIRASSLSEATKLRLCQFFA
jgi:predicted phosphodiesterase